MIVPILIGTGIGIAVMLATWYRIVPPSEAHIIVSKAKTLVCSSDKEISIGGGKSTYFAIPSFLPFVGRYVRKVDLTIKEIVGEQITYEKDQARYRVKYSLKYKVNNVETAAKTFTSDEELRNQLNEVIRAAVRAITVKYDVVQARAKKQTMSKEIEGEISDDLSQWGLDLVNFVLCDFKDTEESTIISNISLRREVAIAALTREQNAEKKKQARVKEAEAEEKAKSAEIKKDEEIAKREQIKRQKVAEEEKKAKDKEYEVKMLEAERQAQIEKKQAEINIKKEEEVAKVNREVNRLKGEAERLRLEEIAKGNAAGIREKGIAEALALDKKQEALNKFDKNAIAALVAKDVVEAQKQIGIKTAEALKTADVKLFAGDADGKQSFDLGQLISAAQITNEKLAGALLNKIARPNDLGLGSLNFFGKEDEKPKGKDEKPKLKPKAKKEKDKKGDGK